MTAANVTRYDRATVQKTHSGCACMHKVKPKSLAQRGQRGANEAPPLGEEPLASDGWMLEATFFKNVVPENPLMFQ